MDGPAVSPEKPLHASAPPARYPWYAHLVSGYALTGAFCWLLVACLFWRRGRRRLAAALAGVNVLLLVTMTWAALRLETAWWRLDSLILGANLVWAMSAWLVQYRLFGPAPPRYRPDEWHRWLLPLTTGALLGAGLAVCLAVVPAAGERLTALYNHDAAVRSSVLWQFFKGLPLGIALGLLTGAWWAGERRFTSGRVISFLAGIGTMLVVEVILVAIFSLVVYGSHAAAGARMVAGDAWALAPGVLHGWPRVLAVLAKFNWVALIPVGMLFGAPVRIRDFMKRAAIVVPLVVGFGWALSFSSGQTWRLIQGEVIYQTTSPRAAQRQAAFGWLQVMLARFPDHAQWPYLATRLADDRYAQGATGQARALYRRIAGRYADSNQWHTQVAMARSILASPHFGEPSKGARLTIPMVNYQAYLTRNWMALLADVRYWQGDRSSVSELLIRLREISKSDSKMVLPQLTGPADLDDAAACLGYGLTILPAGPRAARKLIEAGIPVLLPVYQTFYLIYGFDDSLGLVHAYCFGQLSPTVKSKGVEEVQEVLMLKAEGRGRSKAELARIAREADCTWSLDQWRTGRLNDAAPWMAVICPPDKQSAVAAALGQDVKSLSSASRGLLAAMIALDYYDNADPVNCIRWAQIAGRSSDDPLVWQAAYLGASLWQQRDRRLGTAFRLEKRLSVLGEVDRFMNTEAVRRFVETARQRFAEDLKAGRLNWPIRKRLLWLLDREDAGQRRQIIELLRADLATNPADAARWRQLADLYALDERPAERAAALAGAWSADPQDASTGLAWARACVRLNDAAQADRILQRIELAKVRHKSDYPFCLGAIAEWKNRPRAALRYYARATDMCRYRPAYFLRYGRLLMARGDTAAARKALAWAARIDAGGKIRQAAQQILADQRSSSGAPR